MNKDKVPWKEDEHESQPEYARAAGGLSSQGGQPAFLRKLCATPLLTQAEETKWAKQYLEAQEFLKTIVDGHSELIGHVFARICENASKVRLANYFEFVDDRDGEVREVFQEKAPQILRKMRKSPSEMPMSRLLKELHPLRTRMEFYSECLDLLENGDRSCAKFRRGRTRQISSMAAARAKMKEAQDVLVERNLRLVMSIAWRYAGSGIPVADLVQEGNIGLLRSVERYDYRLGHCFSTYASYWIRQYITHLIMSHSRIIRMPVNTIRQLQKIRQVEQKYMAETGTAPDISVIAEETGLSCAKIRALQQMSMQPVSLQSITVEDGTLENIVSDRSIPSPLENAKQESFREAIHQILGQLNEREQEVIRLRFGLDGEDSLTLVEISERIGISSERVRQIEKTALQKMRQPCMKRIVES